MTVKAAIGSTRLQKIFCRMYSGADDETYFDFSWKDMRGKSLGFITLDYCGTEGIGNHIYIDIHWDLLLVDLLTYLEKSLNFRVMWKEHHLNRYFFTPDYNNGEFRITLDIGQKYGVTLHALSLFRALRVADPSAKFDFSIGVDSSVFSILTPHSKFVPQYLLILRAFTLTTWIFILR